MRKRKLIDIILSAVSALITAAKAFIRFIGCIVKMRQESESEPAASTA